MSLAAVTYVPLQVALFGGNVSGWLTVGVATMLRTGVLTGEVVVAALSTLVKLTPFPFLAAAVVDPRARRWALAMTVSVVIVSVVIAPAAWTSWVSILPNVAGNPMSQVANFSPVRVFSGIGLAAVGTLLGWALAIGSGSIAILLAVRNGFAMQSMAAATLAVTVASPTLWDHYLAVVRPLIVAAWDRVDWHGRLVFFAYLVACLWLWYGYGSWLPYSAAILGLLVAVTVVIAAVPGSGAAARSSGARPSGRAQPVTRHG